MLPKSYIALNNVSKGYREASGFRGVLNQAELSIVSGEFVAVVGPSGSGKSTLLHLLCGIDVPDSGDVVVASQEISSLSETERTLFRRKNIGLVFQFFNLIPTLSVRENLLLPLELNHVDGGEASQRVDEYLARVHLTDRAHTFPEQLSGGEQQRIAVGRALIHKPDVLLADEPTGNLDAKNANDIITLLRELSHENGTTVVMATHSEQAVALADRKINLASLRSL